MIGTIENSIIGRISGVSESGALGYRFRQIKTYGGELRDQQARAGIKDVPAAWLAFDGADTVAGKTTNAYTHMLGRFVLLIAVENLRNEQAARHGAHGDVGAYQIAVDMAGLLAGWPPAEAGRIHNIRISPVSVDDTRNGRLAVYAISFSCEFPVVCINPDVDLENPLNIVHTNWDLPPSGNVGPDLPDDEHSDAISHIERGL
jgi:phage gp37-like protein